MVVVSWPSLDRRMIPGFLPTPHGANDPRVPIVETEQTAKAKNRADAYPKVLAFFRRHMGT